MLRESLQKPIERYPTDTSRKNARQIWNNLIFCAPLWERQGSFIIAQTRRWRDIISGIHGQPKNPGLVSPFSLGSVDGRAVSFGNGAGSDAGTQENIEWHSRHSNELNLRFPTDELTMMVRFHSSTVLSGNDFDDGIFNIDGFSLIIRREFDRIMVTSGNQSISLIGGILTDSFVGPDLHTIVITSTPALMVLFVDGIQVGFDFATHSRPSTSENMGLGGSSTTDKEGFGLNGRIAVAALLNKALTAPAALKWSRDPYGFLRHQTPLNVNVPFRFRNAEISDVDFEPTTKTFVDFSSTFDVSLSIEPTVEVDLEVSSTVDLTLDVEPTVELSLEFSDGN